MSIQRIRSDYISGRRRADRSTGERGEPREGGWWWGGGLGGLPLTHPTDDKTPSTIHLCVMAVPWSDVASVLGELTPANGRRCLSGQMQARDNTNRSNRETTEGRLGGFPLNYLNLNISRRTKMSHSLNIAPCECPSVRVESAHAGLNPVEGRACPRHLSPQPTSKKSKYFWTSIQVNKGGNFKHQHLRASKTEIIWASLDLYCFVFIFQ